MFVMCSPISLPPFESWNITKSSQVTYHRAQEAAGWHEFDSSGPFLFLVDTRCNEWDWYLLNNNENIVSFRHEF